MDPIELSEKMKNALTEAGIRFAEVGKLVFETTIHGRISYLGIFENDDDLISYRVSGSIPSQVTQSLTKAINILKAGNQ